VHQAPRRHDPLSLPGEFLNYTVREPLGGRRGSRRQLPADHAALQGRPRARDRQQRSIIKPSETRRLVALRVAELFLEAGLPDGALNVVTGLRRIVGAALAAHD
jgi:hypothetical protein